MLQSVVYPTHNEADVMFAGVVVVCRTHPRIAPLDHVMKTINSFMFVNDFWTVSSAAIKGYPRLVKILLARPQEHPLDARMIALVFNHALQPAARAGRLSVFEDFVKYFPGLIFTHAANEAAAHGQLHVLEWLFCNQEQVCWTEDVFAAAVLSGQTRVTQTLMNRYQMSPPSDMLSIAVKNNFESMAAWTYVHAAEQDCVREMQEAFAHAELPLAKVLWRRANPDIVISIDNAAIRGDLKYIVWATSLHRAVATTDAFDGAAANGHLGTCQWLAANRSEGFTANGLNRAALAGRRNIIALMIALGAKVTSESLFNAAVGGHLITLELLHRHRGNIRYPPQTFDRVCGSGHLEIAKWILHKNVSRPTYRAMDSASENGYIVVVKWLDRYCSEGCSTNAMNGAAINGHLGVVKYLHEHRSEGCTTAAIDGAARYGFVETIEYLRAECRAGCTSVAIKNAAASGNVDMVAFISDTFSPGWTSSAIDAAIAGGHHKVLKWFMKHGSIEYDASAVDTAVLNGHFGVLDLLRFHGVLKCMPAAFEHAVQAGNLYGAGFLKRFCPDQADMSVVDEYATNSRWLVAQYAKCSLLLK